MKLKGRRFQTVCNIQRNFQAVLDSIKENATVLLKSGKNDGIAVYIPKKDYFEGDGSQN
jgi:hypothetical protein